ncbi:MAG: Na+/H+ antiporter subunit E [Candidatus Thiodiazotropha sp.]|jgi:multicomponent Na+:H+ antiporter subunit E
MTIRHKDLRGPLGFGQSCSLYSGLNGARSLHGLFALGLAALIWFLLTGDDWRSWMVGLPVVLVAAWSAVRLRGSVEPRINLLGLLRFLPFFVWESVLGGLDVVSRVMRPRMRIAPGFVDYRMALENASARLLFVNSLSLLPGTLAADLDGDLVRIHALDLGADPENELIRLERAVAAVYGEAI